MGWASGSSLAADVWWEVREYIPKGTARTACLVEIIKCFEAHDGDTLCDNVGDATEIGREWLAAMTEIYPEHYLDDE